MAESPDYPFPGYGVFHHPASASLQIYRSRVPGETDLAAEKKQFLASETVQKDIRDICGP